MILERLVHAHVHTAIMLWSRILFCLTQCPRSYPFKNTAQKPRRFHLSFASLPYPVLERTVQKHFISQEIGQVKKKCDGAGDWTCAFLWIPLWWSEASLLDFPIYSSSLCTAQGLTHQPGSLHPPSWSEFSGASIRDLSCHWILPTLVVQVTQLSKCFPSSSDHFDIHFITCFNSIWWWPLRCF